MKYLFTRIIISISIILSICSGIFAQQVEDPAALFSPEALQKMEQDAYQIKKELEEKNPAEYQKLLQLEERLNKLSPEEQVQFLFMDEGEQKSFIEKLSQDLPPVQMPPMPSEPLALPTMPEVKAEAEKKDEPKKPIIEPSQQEKVLSIIDGINNGTNASIQVKNDAEEVIEHPGFLRQIGMLKGYVNEGRLAKWAKQGKLSNWDPSYKWSEIKDKIEKLTGVLYKIKEPEKRGKDYKHLDNLVLDTALTNNLDHLKTVLFTELPIMKVEEDSLSEETKKAIANIISAYIEAIYVTKLPEELQKVIDKYDPTAKKLAEEEAAIAKKAIEESKREPRYEPTVYGGTPESPSYSFGGSSSPSYDYGSSYIPSYTPSYSYGGGDFGYPSAYDFAPPSGSSSDFGGGPSLGGRATGGSGGTGGSRGEEKEAEGGGSDKSRKIEPIDGDKKDKKDVVTDDLVKDFGSNIKDAANLIKSSKLGDIKKHLFDAKTKNANPKIVAAIQPLIDKIESAADNLETLKSNPISKKNRDTIKSYEGYRKKINELYSTINELKTMYTVASEEKQRAFYGKPEQKRTPAPSADQEEKEQEELPEAAKAPTLNDIAEAIEKLNKVFNSI